MIFHRQPPDITCPDEKGENGTHATRPQSMALLGLVRFRWDLCAVVVPGLDRSLGQIPI